MILLFFLWILSISTGLNALVEGDIAVPRLPNGQKVKDSFILNPSQLWSNGLVPFVFEKLPLEGGGEEPVFSDKHKQMIRDAMAHISEQVPCIKFREVSREYRGAHIIFSSMGDDGNSPNGCWAYVGCVGSQGGKSGQTVNYGSPDCFNMGTILHEIMHSLGATHEQNRSDRDKYVRIVEDQIIETARQNFVKTDSLFSSHETPYDYESVMHYGEYYYSVSGKKTLVPLLESTTIRSVSSKTRLSTIDTMELAHVYNSLTANDCYRRDTIMEYLKTVQKMLNQSQFRGATLPRNDVISRAWDLYSKNRDKVWEPQNVIIRKSNNGNVHELHVELDPNEKILQIESSSRYTDKRQEARIRYCFLDCKIRGKFLLQFANNVFVFKNTDTETYTSHELILKTSLFEKGIAKNLSIEGKKNGVSLFTYKTKQ